MKERMDRKQADNSDVPHELDRPGKLMVSGIPKREDYAEKDLEKVFTQYGRLTEVHIVRDKRTNIPRGFAFVTYENPKDSLDAIKAVEGKDLGGENKVHCEQARIGYKLSMMRKNQDPGARGGRGSGHGMGRGNESNTGRGAHGGRGMMDRGMADRGRGLMDRGRGLLDRGRGLLDRGRGLLDRSRGLMGRGAMEMPPLERAMYDADGFEYQEEEFYEEFYDLEPPQMRFPPPIGGPGGHPMRGALATRGRQIGQSAVPFRGKQGLLPDPLGRGGRLAPNRGSLLGPPPDDLYGDDANEADYFGDQGNPFAEVQEEPFAEEENYPAEEYYEQEWSAQPRGRGALVSRGRGLIPRGRPQARAPRQQQIDDYDYESEAAPTQRSRPQALAPRRGPQAYDEDLYEEEDLRLSGGALDPYSRGRGRAQASAAPSASSARVGRGHPPGRPGAAPVRRAGPLLEADPYGDEDSGLYERVAPNASLRGGPRAAAEYEDEPYSDPYGRRLPPAGSSRQPVVGRSRAALLSSDSVYPGDRSQPKPLMGADNMTSRKPGLGAGASRFDDDDDEDDYQGPGVTSTPQARAAYSDGRRPPVRRGAPDLGMVEEMYDRTAASPNEAYASFPPGSRVPGNPFSDPYSRKRPIDPYDEPEMGCHGMSAVMREYEELRSAAIVSAKRDRPGDRGDYDPYRRQESLYRGGL